jgi:AraC family transcriptional regulator of adaptative response/methylated-DNA-[protein]-cysteine methyltransferase
MSDYDRIAKAIDYISKHRDCQPALEEVAAQVHLSPYHFQRLFSRWAGVSPKRFLQVLTVERAKQLLLESESLMGVSDQLGLSSASRLYDHFIQLEAMTPGQFKTGGQGVDIDYGVVATPFGDAFLASTERGICSFEFIQQPDVQPFLVQLADRWPQAEFRKNQVRVDELARQIFSDKIVSDKPLSLHVSGTNFQVMVWRALLQIPVAKVASYQQVAKLIKRPKAARAIGQAVGKNPVAFLIPCHRVIQQSGNLGGYHWGQTRKQAIHVWEAARESNK